MNDVDVNRSLSNFLQTRGVRLSDYGSAEFGVSRSNAINFIELLTKTGKNALGIEVWRRHGNKYKIDSLGGWYSDGPDIEEDRDAAKNFIRNATLTDDDLLTIQFD